MSAPAHEGLSAAEVAKYFDVSPMTVTRWVKRGELRPANIPNPMLTRKRYRFSVDELERFRQARTAQPIQRAG